MSFSNSAESSILKLIFNATLWANVAINATSSPITNIFVSLHTADPGEAGDQTTSEITYTSYGRATVARTTGGWTETTGSISPVANIDFAAGTGGSGTATYFGVGTLVSTAGVLIMSGTISPNIVCGNGVTPRLTTATVCSLD